MCRTDAAVSSNLITLIVQQSMQAAYLLTDVYKCLFQKSMFFMLLVRTAVRGPFCAFQASPDHLVLLCLGTGWLF